MNNWHGWFSASNLHAIYTLKYHLSRLERGEQAMLGYCWKLTDFNMLFSTCCLIRLQRIYNFWCSMLVFTPFANCFITLSGTFYAFSGTNLLTSCHSASFLFSAVFLFQKWYTGNILRIGRNKFLNSYFSRKLPEIRRRDGEGPPGPHT
jgi:hypothetical protein